MKDGLAPYRVQHGEIGEICVSGPHVNPGYIDNPAANRETKIFEPDGRIWHRTGDLGYFDDDQRLWLVGRVKDRIQYGDRMMDPFPVEVNLEAESSYRPNGCDGWRRVPAWHPLGQQPNGDDVNATLTYLGGFSRRTTVMKWW